MISDIFTLTGVQDTFGFHDTSAGGVVVDVLVLDVLLVVDVVLLADVVLVVAPENVTETCAVPDVTMLIMSLL